MHRCFDEIVSLTSEVFCKEEWNEIVIHVDLIKLDQNSLKIP